MFKALPYSWGTTILLLISSIAILHQRSHHTSINSYKHQITRVKDSFAEQNHTRHFVNQLMVDSPQPLPTIQLNENDENTEQSNQRRQVIKEAFLHGWKGYKQHAFGSDELKPLTNQSHNPFGGLGVMLIDSLSTMIIMDLHNEVFEVLPRIKQVNVAADASVSVFETIIRCLGGLLSAYELSDHPQKEVLLNKAEEFGTALLPAFDTPFGIPYSHYNLHKQQGMSNSTYLADAGTVHLELSTLSYHTKNPIFDEKAQKITQFFYSKNPIPKMTGLFPIEIDLWTGTFTSDVSFGPLGDSAYEYFLKRYVLTEGREPQYARLYKNAVKSMKSNMLVQALNSSNIYLPSYNMKSKKKNDKMDHLTCFVPGMLAIGSRIFNQTDDLEVAKRILDTCVTMYRTTPTGLAPEFWQIQHPKPMNAIQEFWRNPSSFRRYASAPTAIKKIPTRIEIPRDMKAYDARYLLRPETIESLFILYRITGDPIYQEYGWDIFKSIEKYCKTPSAYAAVRNVFALRKRVFINQINSMETFLFAETFKYLYLLFSPTNTISLDKYVFNTEAHPLLRRNSEL